MAKPKPTEIIRHEIVLGAVEREQMETLVSGISGAGYANAAVSLLKDAAAISTLLAILEWAGIIDMTGLAKKLGGYGKDWLDALLAGVFASFEEALAAWEKRMQDLYPDWFPGGTPWSPLDLLPEPSGFNPFRDGENLSPAEKAVAANIIYRQQNPAAYGYGVSAPGPAYPGGR